jgi:hypothetical protein
MKVSLDGGETFIDAPAGVRVVYENVDTPDFETGEVHVNMTDEGIIVDVWARHTNVGTDSETVGELVDRVTRW